MSLLLQQMMRRRREGGLTLLGGEVAYYPFDTPYVTPTSALDVSGNGLHAAFVGTPAPTFPAGKVGDGCVALNGSNYLNIAASALHKFYQADFSVAFWLNFGSWGPAIYTNIISRGGSSWRITQKAALNTINLTIPPTYSPEMTSATSVETGVWHHWAFVRDYTNSKAYIYHDGEIDKTINSVTTVGTDVSAAVLIGKDPNSANYLTGSLDDVRLFNRALSAADVAALHALA